MANLLIDNILQASLGTCSTFLSSMVLKSFIDPFPAMKDKLPLAILTFLLPKQGQYEWNKLEMLVIGSEAPKLIIYGAVVK